jgi:SAM-dependent methyltransferase
MSTPSDRTLAPTTGSLASTGNPPPNGKEIVPPGAPLHTLNPTGRFSDRAADYRLARPDYAPGAIAHLLEGLDTARLTAVDLGAGTGISSRQVADRLSGSACVLAVEPNGAMRLAAEAHPRVRWIEGTAERTGLPDASAEVVLAAQAFHWFKLPEAFIEMSRVLRPGGRLAVLSNERDWSDPATIEYGELLRRASLNHPAETRHDTHAPIFSTPHFRLSDARLFGHEQRLSLDGLLARARSSSYCPKAGPAWDELARGLRSLHARMARADGLIRIGYITSLHLCERA